MRPALPQPRVAVIGAGVSGLAAVRCLLEVGLAPVCYERTASLGGLWNFDETLSDGGTVGYRSLRTNTSKLVTAFSDFPFPDDYPDFPTRQQFLDYLGAYADHFELRPHIFLTTEVEALEPDGAGGWRVRVRALAAGGADRDEHFAAVLVCTGFNSQPYVPNFPGAETFQGTLWHSASYKGPEALAGQRVVVVGSSSSAADVAVEVSRVAPGLLLATRGDAWMVPRTIGGRPTDLAASRLVNWLPPRWRARALHQRILAEYERLGIEAGRYLPAPEFDLKRIRLTPGIELLEQIRVGAIHPRPPIARLAGGEVVFEDGSRAAADVIIAATGYRIRLPFVDPAVVEVLGDTMWLYRHIFPPRWPTLAFIGFCTVGAPVPPAVELQCRWVAAILAGRQRLPPAEAQQASVDQHRAECATTQTHPMKLKMPAYSDELAAEIGAQPRLWRHLDLLPRLLLGPMVAAQYRLDGPGRSPEAAATIRQPGRAGAAGIR